MTILNASMGRTDAFLHDVGERIQIAPQNNMVGQLAEPATAPMNRAARRRAAKVER